MTDEAPKRGRGRPKGTGAHPYRLTPRQGQFVAHYLRHSNASLATREAGFAPSYTNKLLKVPAVVEAIAAARKAVQIKTEYNLEAAMKDLHAAADFAILTKNATALVRAREMQARLHGLLIERLDQRSVGSFTLVIGGIDTPETVEATKRQTPAPIYEDVFAE